MAVDKALLGKIENFKNLSFDDLLSFTSMSQEQIKENADYLDWRVISRFAPIISYEYKFIEDYIDQWDWPMISLHQPLTLEFIEKFESSLPLEIILYNDCLKSNKKIREIVNQKIKIKRNGNTNEFGI